MSSEQEQNDILSKICSFEVFKDIESNLAHITNWLERETCSSEFRSVLEIILRDSFNHVSIDDIQSQLLEHVLPLTQTIFTDSLESISFNLETDSVNSPSDTQFSLNQLLKVSLDVLDGYTSLLSQVLSLPEPCPIQSLNSIPKTLISVTSAAFQHCKNSESNYGTYFPACSTRLSSLFRKSYQVETCLLKVLDEKLIFEPSHEDDVSLLLQVLEKVIEISDIVCSLELSAVVDEWKGFIKLNTKYNEHLHGRLDLTPAFNSLTSSLYQVLSSITESDRDNDDEGKAMLNRNLKLSNFILKVIIKLCELYTGYISRESHRTLLQLLITLYGKDMELVGRDVELSQLFRSYITVGASPLLSHLLQDTSFIQELKVLCCDGGLKRLRSDCKVGCYVLSVQLSKKLLTCTCHIQKNWIQQDFLSIIINIISDCSEDIINNCSCVYVDGREAYSVLVSTCAIFLTTHVDNVDQYHNLELNIFQLILSLSTNISTIVFLQDLLCLLARLTCEDVVIGWLDRLESLLSDCELKPGKHPNLLLLESLVQRLCTFLSAKTYKSRYKSHGLDIDSRASLSDFFLIVKSFKEVRMDSSSCSKFSEQYLLDIWSCLCETIPRSVRLGDDSLIDVSYTKSCWWYTLLLALTRSTCYNIQHIIQITPMMDMLRVLAELTDIFTNLCVIQILDSLFKHSATESICKSVCNILLVSSLLDSKHCLVKLSTLKVLAQIHKSKYDVGMQLCLSERPDSANLVSEYLNRRIVVSTPLQSQDIFTQGNKCLEFIHKCLYSDDPTYVRPVIENNENEPPSKKLKTCGKEFNHLIAKSKLIYTEMKKYLEDESGSDNGLLSDSQKHLLNDVITRYQSLSQYL